MHKGEQTIKRKRIRSSDPSGHVIGYVEGWAISETGKHGDPNASAETMARVYMALERRRHVQTSKGLMKLGERPTTCGTCGARGSFEVDVKSWRSPDLEELARKLGWVTWTKSDVVLAKTSGARAPPERKESAA